MIGFHKFLPHEQIDSTSIVLMIDTLHHFMAVFSHVFSIPKLNKADQPLWEVLQ